MRCSVQNCLNGSKNIAKNQGITFHLFPKDPTLRCEWLEALCVSDWEPKERSTVCSEHFRDMDFYETKTGRKLQKDAVPIAVMDPVDAEAPAASRVCRVCLATDASYDIRACSLDHHYEQITGIFFGMEDRLPQRLCWECAHRLRSAMAFRNKALRAHGILAEMLHSTAYITMKDIKTINRLQYKLRSTLIRTSHDNKSNIIIQNNDIIKSETHNGYNHNEYNVNVINHSEYNDNGNNHSEYVNNDNEYNGDEIKVLDNIMEVEVKDESANEIFFDEYVDNFESDDDKKLSEIYPDVMEKKKVKVKKRKLRVEKKERVVKKKEEGSGDVKKSQEDDGISLLDKYKTNEIKRRKNDGPDENLFTIASLTYEEQIAEIEKRQDSGLYKNAQFKCTTCYRGFQIKERYEAHVVRHTEQCGLFECFICKTRLKTSRALRKHLTAQHTEKFSCKGCPFVTRNRGVAREHEKWHSGTKYQCPHCPSTFEKITTYMGHIRIKHVSDFVCELCGFTFVSQKGIEVHKKKKHRLHERVELAGPYCELCKVKFVSEEAHARHLKISAKHSSDYDPNRIRNDSQSIRSEQSRARPASERRLSVNPRVQPTTGRGPVTCEQCGVQLRNLRLYAQHFIRAHPEKNRTKYPDVKTPWMCERCGQIFPSMSHLKDHMWVHTGEKRFKCSHCPKSFTKKPNLLIHERFHSGSHPTYKCELCGKQFAFYNNKRRHMFIHTGQKPYKCDTCGKCFTTTSEQRAHIDHVHLKKPWPRRARRALQGAREDDSS